MRQAIMREQEQRRLQYLQQMQDQQRHPGAYQQGAGSQGQPEGSLDQTGQSQPESGPQSDLQASATGSITSISPETELKATNIKTADLQAPPSRFKTAGLQAQPAYSPGGSEPCAPGSTPSWGHPVWWGWSDTTGCGE
ncbi:hypothetical protein PtA15_6A863 [Puccinia triticina]|nr:uncharacterized protein PtA15_6A863 [Puccinia triticina]WAQ86231.1 hypothetical protein PtA15_6A863 [Puccinia triticina]